MPKIVDHDERRDHIVAALYEVLAREGFGQLNMRKIASEAGYSHGAIARYFPNKQAVLKATFYSMIEQWQERFQEATDDLRGLEGLEALCKILWPLGETGRRNANVVVALWNEAITDQEFHDIQRENNSLTRSRIKKFLSDAQDRGEVSSTLDVTAMAWSIMVRSMGWHILAALSADEAADNALHSDIHTLMTGLRTGAPGPE